ncbi:MAG: M23 family metallopeptidase [Clostridia bacterium]
MSKSNVNGNAFVRFLRNNIALIIISICLLAIVTIVIVASVNANEPTLPVDGNKPTDTTDDPDDDKPTTDPSDDVPTGGDGDITSAKFELPVSNFTIGMDYTNDTDNLFVFSSTLKRWQSHRATDFLATSGTAVTAMRGGTVTEVGNNYALGDYVTVDHGDGVVATYASMQNLCVVAGQTVAKGEKIGEVSNSAGSELADGAHLHLAVKKDGKYVSPWTILTKPAQ